MEPTVPFLNLLCVQPCFRNKISTGCAGIYSSRFFWIILFGAAPLAPFRIILKNLSPRVPQLRTPNELRSHENRLLLGEGEAEAKVEVPIVGGAAATVRRATVPGVVGPTATTIHAALPTVSALRIRLASAAVAAPPIATPLMHVSAHVVKAKLVRTLRSYFMSAIART